MLHDVLYIPEIRRNLVSMPVLLDLDFNLNFSRSGLRITQDNVFFMVLDIVIMVLLC